MSVESSCRIAIVCFVALAAPGCATDSEELTAVAEPGGKGDLQSSCQLVDARGQVVGRDSCCVDQSTGRVTYPVPAAGCESLGRPSPPPPTDLSLYKDSNCKPYSQDEPVRCGAGICCIAKTNHGQIRINDRYALPASGKCHCAAFMPPSSSPQQPSVDCSRSASGWAVVAGNVTRRDFLSNGTDLCTLRYEKSGCQPQIRTDEYCCEEGGGIRVGPCAFSDLPTGPTPAPQTSCKIGAAGEIPGNCQDTCYGITGTSDPVYNCCCPNGTCVLKQAVSTRDGTPLRCEEYIGGTEPFEWRVIY